MMRGRGRGRGAAGGFRGRGRGRGAAPPQQQPQQQQPGTQQQKQQNSTDSNFDDDPFSNIVGGGGAGKTSQTAQIPVLHKQASDHTVKRIGADAAEKYQPPPLYPEVAIDKRSVKPLTDEDFFLLNKHRLIRSRNRQSPYFLKREKLYDLDQLQQQQSKDRRRRVLSSGTALLNNGRDNFGLGEALITPSYFPIELAQDSLKRVKRVKRKKSEKVDNLFKTLESEDNVNAENDEEEKEDGDEEEIIIEEDLNEYDFSDDYQYARNDDDDDMGDDDTLNAAGAGDDGPLI